MDFILAVLLGVGALSHNSVVTQSVPYDSNHITTLGRVIDTGSGYYSGWGCTQHVFTVSGTNEVQAVFDVSDTSSTERISVQYVIDNLPVDMAESVLTGYNGNATIFSGSKSSTIKLPDTGTHTITLQPVSIGYAAQFLDANRVTLKEIQIQASGSLSTWEQGLVDLQVIGDSWTAAFNGYTRLLDRSYFKISPLAVPGYVITDITGKYRYDKTGVLNTSDPQFAGIVITFGVNETVASVTTAQFKTNMLALIDEIRTAQPTAKIIMVRTPSNTAQSMDYGQYGTVQSEITGLRSNTYYYDTSALDAQLVGKWKDLWHLNADGKVILKSGLDTYLKTTAGL